MKKVVLFANTDWYLFNFRLSLAKYLRDNGWSVLLMSPPGPYVAELEDAGFRWLPVPMQRRSLNPLRELLLVLHLCRLFRKERPDVVHGFTIKCAVYGSLAARLARVRQRVNAVAGLGFVFTNDSLKARVLRPLVRTLMRATLNGRGASLILQNPDDVAMFINAGIVDKSCIHLIPGSGVNVQKFAQRAKDTSGTPRPIRVLLAARLLWDKGIAEYVEAARALRNSQRSFEFLLAGDPDEGNPASVPTKTVEAWVEEGTLTWLGHVGDMPALLRDIDIMVLPSYREGLPKAMIEAAACGIALVTTDAPGCREVVSQDGVDGLRVLVKDGVALTDAIARLHDDPVLRETIGANARVRALAEFDERIVIERTVAVYGTTQNA
ncbi:glycosyltransferase family 4 protein [Caballeronia sp. GAWG2-1]|uniref:glycosyltransferase family 4 protein n=1 Tax=Caballeronia sp. GAWG2-1 TaxID=2921744 RepID=UPI002027B30C|nr:glycosyltransferase family 4 protein [Caballeronia sp. GAWG2-1]